MNKEDLAAARVAVRIMEKTATDYLYGPTETKDVELLRAVNNVLEALEEAGRLIEVRKAKP